MEAGECEISTDENILKLDICDGCTTPHIVKTTKLYALEEWSLYELYLNKGVNKKIQE